MPLPAGSIVIQLAAPVSPPTSPPVSPPTSPPTSPPAPSGNCTLAFNSPPSWVFPCTVWGIAANSGPTPQPNPAYAAIVPQGGEDPRPYAPYPYSQWSQYWSPLVSFNSQADMQAYQGGLFQAAVQSGLFTESCTTSAPPPPPPSSPISPPTSPPTPTAPPLPPGVNGSSCTSPLYVQICPTTSPPPPASPGSPPAPAAPPAPCSLSISDLSYHHPQFVIAERAAMKTDYDILLDAYNLNLCPGSKPQMPECSVPYLERMVPDFVRAAKSQGKTDVEMLKDAIAIGLCAEPTQVDITELGEVDVESLAPGSESVILAEFDPPASAPQVGSTVNTGPQGSCPAVQWVIPDYSPQIQQAIPPDILPLVGWDRVVYGLALAVAGSIRDICQCRQGSAIDLLFQLATKAGREWSIVGKVMEALLGGFGQSLQTIACNIGVADNYVTALTGCDAGETAPVAILGLVAGVWERWVGALPTWAKAALDRAAAYTCPTQLPTAPEANALLAHNFVSRPEWETMQRLEGNRLDYQAAIVDMTRSRPADDQLLLLFRRWATADANLQLGIPQPGDPDAQTLQQWGQDIPQLFAANGWTNQQWWNYWATAQEWVPTPTDAVEWMLKDVADPQIQNTFLLGAEFTQKYQGHVKDVFAWNGIKDTDANFIWRAHWRNMAPTTLYELHKRLRPGWTALMSDAEVVELTVAICPRVPQIPGFDPLQGRPVSNGFPVPTYCEELTTPEIARAWLESLATTGYHVSEGLGQSDYAPFWRQRLLAVSYRVLGRIDLRRAYEQNLIEFDRLVAGYQDQGYSPGDATNAAFFTRRLAIQLHCRRPVANSWVKVGYDPALLQQSLQAQGMRPDMWPDVSYVLQTRRQIQIQIECIEGIKSPYIAGVLDRNTATIKLNNLNLDPQRINELISEWDCLKKSKPKHERAAEICLYFKTGLLTGPQAKQLLVELGYSTMQASRILAVCYIRKLPKTVDPNQIPAAIQAIGGLN